MEEYNAIIDEFGENMRRLKGDDVGDVPQKHTNNKVEHAPSFNIESGSSQKQSFADMFKKPAGSKAARLNHMTSEHVAGANVAIPLAAVKEVSDRFENTLYGYFIGKRLAFPVVENYVKNAWKKFGLERVMLTHGFFLFQFATKEGMDRVLEDGSWLIRLVPLFLNIWTPNTRLEKDTIISAPVWVKLYHVPIVAFSQVGLSLITSQLGKPIMLDAYTSSMCQKSWGRNTYARALVEVSALNPLMESVVVAVPFLDGTGYSFETVEVEYEWQPPRCDTCKVFDHVDSKCPKIVKVVDVQKAVDDDGFTKVSNRNEKGRNKGKAKQIAGIRLTKAQPTYFYRDVQPNNKKNDKEALSSNHDDHNGDSTQSERRPLVSVDKDINILELRNSFNSLMDKDKVLDVADSQSSQTNKELLNDDDEEVEDFYVEPDPRILKQQVHSKIGASTPSDEVFNV
ncbi:zinc knuckle CX2CX4HX4C containing protein [Tanacetum coccineum]